LIDQGYEVSVLARDEAKAAPVGAMGAKIVVGDLGDIDAFAGDLAGCDLVVLAGARAVSDGTWQEFVDQNILATERLIDKASDAGARRIVYVSSHADRVAVAAIRAGKPVVIVRPGRIYGHDHPLGEPLYMGRVKKNLGSDLIVVIGSRAYFTPISYVENAADAVVAAGMVEGVDGRIFNIVDDPDLTHKRYFSAVAKLPGFPRKQVFLPVGLFVPALVVVNFLYKLLKRRPWSVAYQLRRSGRNARYSTDAARDALGWAPQVDLDAALQATATGGK
jgi:nucleoside-diphosphate-sugar epimerase